MVGILKPLATLLPFSGALAVARFIGRLAVVTPGYGRRQVLRMRHAFGRDTSPNKLKHLTAERIARPLCDSVVLRRALCGRMEFKTWRVEQRTVRCVDELRSSNESFIVATGHFARQAFLALYGPEVLPQRTTSLSLPRTALGLHPRTWWLSYHYGQMMDCMRALWPELEILYAGKFGTYRRLLEKLGEARNAVVIYADTPRAQRLADSYTRPFAGMEARSFATGTARLSRMSQRPIAVCIPYLTDERTVVLDWTRVIRPSSVRSKDTDRSVTDTILDDIEKAIGRRPAQYVIECLGNRRWDARAERWVAEP